MTRTLEHVESGVEAPRFAQRQFRVLVTRFKSIGDIVFTLPALHALREHYPNIHITFLTSREFASLLEGFANVDEILTVDRSVIRGGNLVAAARETLSFLRLLWRKKFSLVVDFQGYGETALLTWLTRAPERWGTVYQSFRGYAYTRGIKRDPTIHPAEGHLRLLEECGVRVNTVRNHFSLPNDALAEARRMFANLGLDTELPVLFIQPFTSSPRKNWSLENYLALATHWHKLGVQVLFGGGPRDRARLEPVVRAGFPISAGASLLVSAGLASLSTVIVGGDTGLLHIAVAMNKRVVFLGSDMEGRSRFYPFRQPTWKIVPPQRGFATEITLPTTIEACKAALAEAA